MARRKIPPYGKRLTLLQQERLIPDNNIWIHIGAGAWQAALNKNHQYGDDGIPLHLVLPDDGEPGEYRWPVLQNDAIIQQHSLLPGTRVQQLLETLFSDGAQLVVIMQPNFKYACFRNGDL